MRSRGRRLGVWAIGTACGLGLGGSGAAVSAAAAAVAASPDGTWTPAVVVAEGKQFGDVTMAVTANGTEVLAWFSGVRGEQCSSVYASVRPSGSDEWTTPTVVGLATRDPEYRLPHAGDRLALGYADCAGGIAVHRLDGTSWVAAGVVGDSVVSHFRMSVNHEGDVMVAWEQPGTPLHIRSAVNDAGSGLWTDQPDLVRADNRDRTVHALLDDTGRATLVVVEQGPTAFAVATLRGGEWRVQELETDPIWFPLLGGVTSEPGGLLAIVVATGDGDSASRVLAFVRDRDAERMARPVVLSKHANPRTFLSARASAQGDLVVEWGQGPDGGDWAGVPTVRYRTADGTWGAKVRLQDAPFEGAPAVNRNDDGSTVVRIKALRADPLVFACPVAVDCAPVPLPDDIGTDRGQGYKAGPGGIVVANGKQLDHGQVVALRAAEYRAAE